MNKKQEALRRGLRSFIEDTSRELADLEGRELQPAPEPATPPGGEARVVGPEDAAASRSGGPPVSVSRTAAPSTREPLVVPERASPSVPASPPPIDAQEGASRAGVSDPRANDASAASPIDVDRPPPARPGPPPPSPPEGVERSRSVERGGSVEHADGDAPRPRRPAKPSRRAAVPARRRPPRAGAGIASNGVSAEQAHARKGVCFAYFLNHECWRVPDAYCITALQVCITRECPVYHLHKDALERRFARKFKHFW